ncbi:hypothetical protein TL16_g01092 [Triparma laevis f. inornata]|uniref:Uncharacterized protein n=1 Tax=Triparma laevis f. inornata TaxID=1714386 RepID=A0A9W7DQT3_9STRA|nr:hypothetical protein TL16_g01092 [Triparma laevis f. inornata]
MSSFNHMMKQANKGVPKTATSNFPDDKKLEKSFEDQARLWVMPPKCPQKEEMMEQYKKSVKEAKKTATAKSKMPKIIPETTSMGEFETFEEALAFAATRECVEGFMYYNTPPVKFSTGTEELQGPYIRVIHNQKYKVDGPFREFFNNNNNTRPYNMNGAEKNHHQEFCNPFTRFSEVPATYPELAKEEIDIFADGMSLEVQCAFECFRKKIKCKNVKCAGRRKAESTIQWGGGSAGSCVDSAEHGMITGGSLYKLLTLDPQIPKFMVVVERSDTTTHQVWIGRIQEKQTRVAIKHRAFLQLQEVEKKERDYVDFKAVVEVKSVDKQNGDLKLDEWFTFSVVTKRVEETGLNPEEVKVSGKALKVKERIIERAFRDVLAGPEEVEGGEGKENEEEENEERLTNTIETLTLKKILK